MQNGDDDNNNNCHYYYYIFPTVLIKVKDNTSHK
jgi:hypothetical protein